MFQTYLYPSHIPNYKRLKKSKQVLPDTSSHKNIQMCGCSLRCNSEMVTQVGSSVAVYFILVHLVT